MTELEKKAIDVIRNHSHKLIDNFTQEDLENREISIFLAGYHEGNKANEWHYVKDGDLPKEYDTVLVCTEFEQHKSFLICNYHYKKWWYADGKFDEDVIAWKEIVLPELKESE